MARRLINSFDLFWNSCNKYFSWRIFAFTYSYLRLILPPKKTRFDLYMNTAKAILFSLVRITLLIHLPTNLNAEENERWFQFGLFPPISSNGINSEKITTSVSINLIGGYNAGNKILELGSLWNASKRYTKGIQIAGIVNYTGCSHNAVQISSYQKQS